MWMRPVILLLILLLTSTCAAQEITDLDFLNIPDQRRLPQATNPLGLAGGGFAILSDIETFFFMRAAQGDARNRILFGPDVTVFGVMPTSGPIGDLADNGAGVRVKVPVVVFDMSKLLGVTNQVEVSLGGAYSEVSDSGMQISQPGGFQGEFSRIRGGQGDLTLRHEFLLLPSHLPGNSLNLYYGVCGSWGHFDTDTHAAGFNPNKPQFFVTGLNFDAGYQGTGIELGIRRQFNWGSIGAEASTNWIKTDLFTHGTSNITTAGLTMEVYLL